MSKKRSKLSRRNRARANTPKQARKSPSSTPVPAEGLPPAPTGSETSPEKPAPGPDPGGETPLTFRQQSAIPAIAAAPSIAQAARDSGIGERTIHRWLEDEDFRYELTRVRQEQADFASKELQGLLMRGVEVLSDAMDHPDIAVRIRATRCAFSFAPQIVDLEKLKADVQALEEASTLDPPGLPDEIRKSGRKWQEMAGKLNFPRPHAQQRGNGRVCRIRRKNGRAMAGKLRHFPPLPSPSGRGLEPAPDLIRG